jgi:hypothetical protein
MESKEFDFEDGGKATFIIDEDGLTINLQAVYLGKDIKITSTQAHLDKNKMKEFIEWVTLLSQEA